MPPRYDYGSFSKAAPRLLKPGAARMRFQHLEACAFGRERDVWVDGFFLQQSAHGSGDFCVNVGIHVPALDDLWMNEPADRSLGLSIWGRLSPDGVDGGDSWFAAANKSELQASILQVEALLPLADAWFEKFTSMADIANHYESRTDLSHVKEDEHLSTLGIINYGFLLLLAGNGDEAKKFLEIGRAQCQFVVTQNAIQSQKRKPGKETLLYHEQDLRRLRAVENAIAKRL